MARGRGAGGACPFPLPLHMRAAVGGAGPSPGAKGGGGGRGVRAARRRQSGRPWLCVRTRRMGGSGGGRGAVSQGGGSGAAACWACLLRTAWRVLLAGGCRCNGAHVARLGPRLGRGHSGGWQRPGRGPVRGCSVAPCAGNPGRKQGVGSRARVSGCPAGAGGPVRPGAARLRGRRAVGGGAGAYRADGITWHSSAPPRARARGAAVLLGLRVGQGWGPEAHVRCPF